MRLSRTGSPPGKQLHVVGDPIKLVMNPGTNIIVQKYGGSSVATESRLHQVGSRLLALHRDGHAVVAVVSAMGNTTNRLLGLAQCLNDNPQGRELDLLLSSGERISSALLAMAIHKQGGSAVALTGAQAGIRTNDRHVSARIREVETARVHRELAAGRIVIVAGFQGITPGGEVTTLGRGGSDTTAVALAAALDAHSCDICSDVDGIYSADPHVVDGALRLPSVHYDEMLALAKHGAKVLDPRAVAYAKNHGVVIHARSSTAMHKGTLVNGERHREAPIIGVTSLAKLLKLELDRADRALAGKLTEICGTENVYYDATAHGGNGLLISTLNLPEHAHLCTEITGRFGDRVQLVRDVGSVSLVGIGAARLDGALERAAPVRDGVFSSAASCTCVLREAKLPGMVQKLHQHFIENQSGLAAVA